MPLNEQLAFLKKQRHKNAYGKKPTRLLALGRTSTTKMTAVRDARLQSSVRSSAQFSFPVRVFCSVPSSAGWTDIQ